MILRITKFSQDRVTSSKEVRQIQEYYFSKYCCDKRQDCEEFMFCFLIVCAQVVRRCFHQKGIEQEKEADEVGLEEKNKNPYSAASAAEEDGRELAK